MLMATKTCHAANKHFPLVVFPARPSGGRSRWSVVCCPLSVVPSKHFPAKYLELCY